jgi:hypothetical protein
LPASEIVVPFAGELWFCPMLCIGFIGAVARLEVGNLDMSASLAELIDAATPPPSDLVICEVGVPPVFVTLVGEFDPPGVGFDITGMGFVITGIGFVITGIGFIMPFMPDIPDAIDSSSLPSSV